MHYFTLIETQPTFKTAELLRTNLDWIRLPWYIVKEIMKGYKLKKVFGRKERRKRIGGKNEACYNLVGSRLKFFCFRLWGPMQKGIGRMGTRNSDIRSTSAAFNSYFLNNFFGKGIRWISMERLLTFFFLNYCHQNFISFWCSFFFNKAMPICSSFFTRMFFWSKIFFDENFDDMNNFFQKLHKSRFL